MGSSDVTVTVLYMEKKAGAIYVKLNVFRTYERRFYSFCDSGVQVG